MNNKILVCISGGIDSSLATVLLKEQGYDVIAATFRVYDSIRESCLEKMKGCCSIETISEAKFFAEQQGLEHYILDYRDYFSDTVIRDFIHQYTNGRTPNPCVLCNYEIKWGKVLEFAKSKGCDYMATGHYAKISKPDERFVLSKGVDRLKDQSYFLWMLTQEQLSKTIFPLGNMTKDEVRKMALERGFQKLTKKRESQEICFVPDNDYRKFLRENAEDIVQKLPEGNFITSDGTIVGKHKGIENYTIGQRKGLGIALGEPYYVLSIDNGTNEIVLGKYEQLQQNSFRVGNINWISVSKFPENKTVSVKIRYRTKPVKANISIEENHFLVEPLEPLFAITPGQSAVFYDEDDVLAGGNIL
jgi:tRNA-specific 2-thiouridylase